MAVPLAQRTLNEQYFIALAKPNWSRILMAVNALVFVAMTWYGRQMFDTWNGTEVTDVLVRFGAKVNEMIANGQTWRLFNAMFIHIGLLHIAFNLYALNSLGPLVEGFYGHERFLVVYLIGGLWGSVASYAFSDALSAGASGAVFAMVGATTVYFLHYRKYFGARGGAILQNMAVVTAMNLFLGFSSSGIDNFAHIGGLLGGAAIGFGILPKYRAPQGDISGRVALEVVPIQKMDLVWVLAHLALMWLAVRIVTSKLLPDG